MNKLLLGALGLLKRLPGLLAKYPLYTIVAVLVGVIMVQDIRLRHAQARERVLGLEKLALQAQHDTTTDLHGKELAAVRRLYGDSVRAVEKLIVQAKTANAALGKALGQQSKLSADLAVMVRALQAKAVEGTVVVVDTNDTRRSHFAIDSAPYHVQLAVALPPAPRHGIIDSLGIRLDPAKINAHSGCLAKNGDGLRPASLTLTGPPWLSVTLGDLTQDQEVCNPVKASVGSKLKHTALTAVGGAAAWEGLKALLRLLKVTP